MRIEDTVLYCDPGEADPNTANRSTGHRVQNMAVDPDLDRHLRQRATNREQGQPAVP
jgi:hypothetical protein